MSKALLKGGSALCYARGYEHPALAGAPVFAREAGVLDISNSDVDMDAVMGRLSFMLNLLEIEFGLTPFEGTLAAMLLTASKSGAPAIAAMHDVLRTYSASIKRQRSEREGHVRLSGKAPVA